MKTTEFDKHKLVEFLVSTLHDYISRQQPTKIVSPLTEKESYANDILLSANNIIECSQIYFSIELLSGFRKKKNGKMNRHDYIVFMIENFYLRITSILDRSLRFANILFEIGLPERECRESTIIKNNKVKNTKVESSLKEINKFISKFKMTRNQITHSEGFYDKKLQSVATYYFLLETDEFDNFKKYDHIYKTETDNYIKGKKAELTDITVQIEKLVSDLFDNVYPIVIKNLSKYSG